MDTDTAPDVYETALAAVPGSLIPKERRHEAKEAVRRYRDREDPGALADYMASFEAESAEYFQLEHGDFYGEAEAAFLTDVKYAIDIAKPAGALAYRRREKESALGSSESDSDDPEAVAPPRVRICPEDHSHGATQTCYTRHSCRCDECKSSASATRKKYLLAQEPTRTAQPKKRSEWAPKPLAEDDPRHGTRGGYANYRCRCIRCCEASRQYTAEKRKNPSGTKNKISEHGSTGRYVRGCRCALCSAAMSQYNVELKQRRESDTD